MTQTSVNIRCLKKKKLKKKNPFKTVFMTRVVTNTTYHTFQSSIKMKLTNSGALRCYLIKL